MLGGVVGGFDALDCQVRPEAIGHGEQLIAGADRFDHGVRSPL